MRVQENPYLHHATTVPELTRQLTDLHRQLITQLNLLSEGSITANTNAATSAPTGGVVAYQQGDKVWHSAPVEAGAPGSKFVEIGFVCVAAGSPGTWLPMRVLTGN